MSATIFLPGTVRGTMRSMVEGARLSAARTLDPLHHALRARSPSPFRGGAR